MCELLEHITCSLIYRSYVLIKIDDMEAQWSIKIWKTVVLLFKSCGSCWLDIFPGMSMALAHHLTSVLMVLVTLDMLTALIYFFFCLLGAYA